MGNAFSPLAHLPKAVRHLLAFESDSDSESESDSDSGSDSDSDSGSSSDSRSNSEDKTEESSEGAELSDVGGFNNAADPGTVLDEAGKAKGSQAEPIPMATSAPIPMAVPIRAASKQRSRQSQGQEATTVSGRASTVSGTPSGSVAKSLGLMVANSRLFAQPRAHHAHRHGSRRGKGRSDSSGSSSESSEEGSSEATSDTGSDSDSVSGSSSGGSGSSAGKKGGRRARDGRREELKLHLLLGHLLQLAVCGVGGRPLQGQGAAAAADDASKSQSGAAPSWLNGVSGNGDAAASLPTLASYLASRRLLPRWVASLLATHPTFFDRAVHRVFKKEIKVAAAITSSNAKGAGSSSKASLGSRSWSQRHSKSSAVSSGDKELIQSFWRNPALARGGGSTREGSGSGRGAAGAGNTGGRAGGGGSSGAAAKAAAPAPTTMSRYRCVASLPPCAACCSWHPPSCKIALLARKGLCPCSMHAPDPLCTHHAHGLHGAQAAWSTVAAVKNVM